MRILAILFVFLFSNNYAQNSQFVLNPYGNTPLSAEIHLKEINKSPIRLTVHGKTSDMSVIHTFPAGYGNKIPVYGLYDNYENKISLQYGNTTENYTIPVPKASIPRAIKSGNARADAEVGGDVSLAIVSIVDRLPQPDPANQDFYFVSLPVNGGVLAFDRKGDLRYVYRVEKSLFTVARLEVDPSQPNQVVMVGVDNFKNYKKINLLGQDLFNIPLSSHHDMIPYQNNTEFLLGNSQWGWEDVIYILNDKKQIIKTLSLVDALANAIDPKDKALFNNLAYDQNNKATNPKTGKPARSDWAHINSLVYHRPSDTLFLSARHLGVLAIRVKDWTLQWFMANDNLEIDRSFGYGEKAPNSLFLTDIPSLQKYRLKVNGTAPRGQHALLLKKNGHLLLFDNMGDDGDKIGSRAVEYQINPAQKTATEVRQFATSDKQFARLMSDVDLVGDNLENWLLLYGYGPRKRITEVAPDNSVLYDLIINTKAPFSRVDKFPMYPYQNPNKKYTADYLEK